MFESFVAPPPFARVFYVIQFAIKWEFPTTNGSMNINARIHSIFHFDRGKIFSQKSPISTLLSLILLFFSFLSIRSYFNLPCEESFQFLPYTNFYRRIAHDISNESSSKMESQIYLPDWSTNSQVLAKFAYSRIARTMILSVINAFQLTRLVTK